MIRYAYLPGFGSTASSKKGAALASAFVARGQNLSVLDLNRPSFARLSPRAALEAIDDLARSGQGAFRLIGSSFGGWLAARWAELRPERVEKLVLLAPAFDLAARYSALLGAEKMTEWKERGALEFPDVEGRPVAVHYGFYEEAASQPAAPVATCPTLIIHGVRDQLIPPSSSRAYASDKPNVRLLELDDDHTMLASLDEIASETLSFLVE